MATLASYVVAIIALLVLLVWLSIAVGFWPALGVTALCAAFFALGAGALKALLGDEG